MVPERVDELLAAFEALLEAQGRPLDGEAATAGCSRSRADAERRERRVKALDDEDPTGHIGHPPQHSS
jgi:hypothetical protein